jgi:hypothetical protein
MLFLVLGMASPPGPGAGGRGPIALSTWAMPSRSSEPLLQGKRDQKRDHALSTAAAAAMCMHCTQPGSSGWGSEAEGTQYLPQLGRGDSYLGALKLGARWAAELLSCGISVPAIARAAGGFSIKSSAKNKPSRVQEPVV